MFDIDGCVGYGIVWLLGCNVSVKVVGLDMGGDIDVKVILCRGDFNQCYFDLFGIIVEFCNVQVVGVEWVSVWKGCVVFKCGCIDVQLFFQVDVIMDLDFSDVWLLFVLFVECIDYLCWILLLLDFGQVQVWVMLCWCLGYLIIDGLQVENDWFLVCVWLDLFDQCKCGDFYLCWGLLGVSIELDGDQC